MTLEDEPRRVSRPTRTRPRADDVERADGTAIAVATQAPPPRLSSRRRGRRVILVHDRICPYSTSARPGRPREYHFPRFERVKLANGLTVVHAHVPGRPLMAAQLLLPGGGWTEPADQAGVTVLTGRAMPEGTRTRDANEFIEAAERLGAEIHADCDWETLSAQRRGAASRFGPALALLAEMVAEPAFPADEVERLRDERLNDLMQAVADPRRRAERVFPETIYAPDDAVQPAARRRPGDGRRASTGTPSWRAMRQLLDPAAATLVVAGDLTGIDLERLAEEQLWAAIERRVRRTAERRGRGRGAGRAAQSCSSTSPARRSRSCASATSVCARKTPDFHAISVLNAILGGTFGSRLNRVLREQQGYTYGIHSSFDMRRQAGPFAVRTAVQTEVTVPAVLEILRIVRDFRDARGQSDELTAARDYLVGVFPLRFESRGPGRVGARRADRLRAARRRARPLPAAGRRGQRPPTS